MVTASSQTLYSEISAHFECMRAVNVGEVSRFMECFVGVVKCVTTAAQQTATDIRSCHTYTQAANTDVWETGDFDAQIWPSVME